MKTVAMKDIEKITLYNARTGKIEEMEKVVKTEEEWKKILTPDEFKITQNKGTEPAFQNKYHDFKGAGITSACALPTYSARTPYESGTGWPSFWGPIPEQNVRTERTVHGS
jgi:peptide-methionine (R)-S-oxide reductase